MIDYIELDSSPTEELGVQVSKTEDYKDKMRTECNRYRDLLRARFPQFDKVKFVIQTHEHDFGAYMGVSVRYDDNDPVAMHQAYVIEDNQPATWADLSVVELPTEEEE